ncbi:MAG TPA: cation diffusion facilitator family transporter [Mycobacteriales bacterium]
MAEDESTGTVLVALGANLAIAVAKITAGLLSGSSAMLAEGAHSVADTTNQVFLLASLRLGRRPADETHPFGYGKERFFWSLLAAVGIFVTGAAFSVYEGVHGLLSGESSSEGHYLVSYLVLLVSFVAEGISWLRAVAQLRKEARERGRGLLEHVRVSSDPTVKTVFSEDSAALVGLMLAAAGLALHQLTGAAWWDAAAAIAIGVLLAVVAYLLGRDTKELLIGEAAPEPVRRALTAELAAPPEVDRVVEVRTMLVGPARLLIAARLDMADNLRADEVEDVTDRIERELKERHPQISEVFLAVSHRAAQVGASTPEASSASTTDPSATR